MNSNSNEQTAPQQPSHVNDNLNQDHKIIASSYSKSYDSSPKSSGRWSSCFMPLRSSTENRDPKPVATELVQPKFQRSIGFETQPPSEEKYNKSPNTTEQKSEEKTSDTKPNTATGNSLRHRNFKSSVFSCFSDYTRAVEDTDLWLDDDPALGRIKRNKAIQRENNRRLFTYRDLLAKNVREAFEYVNIQLPDHPTNVIVSYLPIYSWTTCDKSKQLKIDLSHCNTIAKNSEFMFGAIQGSKLDPSVDHVINIQLVEGIEFGIGVCSAKNLELPAKRDFMCEKGGFGYYNYKTKVHGMTPKYPPGWYGEKHKCLQTRSEEDILEVGDVLTITVTREGLLEEKNDGQKEVSGEQTFVGQREGNGKFTLRFFKNGESMSYNKFTGIEGPFHLCLNYYFMLTKVKLLSDYKMKRSEVIHQIQL